MILFFSGVVLVFFGILYLRNQDMYRRGEWLKTSIAIRLLSKKNYRRYIKGLGIVFIVVGVLLIYFGIS